MMNDRRFETLIQQGRQKTDASFHRALESKESDPAQGCAAETGVAGGRKSHASGKTACKTHSR